MVVRPLGVPKGCEGTRRRVKKLEQEKRKRKEDPEKGKEKKSETDSKRIKARLANKELKSVVIRLAASRKKQN